MSDRNESNLEYRATFDFSQAREEIASIQESLRTMEQIGLAAFITIEDRAATSAAQIVGKFSQAAKASGVTQIATEVTKAMGQSEAAAEKMAAKASSNLKEVSDAIDDVREAAARLDEETRPDSDSSSVLGWFDDAERITSRPLDWVRERQEPPDFPPIPDLPESGIQGAAAAAADASTEFSTLSQMLGLSGKEAEKADAIYARLLTQELKLIASGDDLTRALASRIGARRPEADMISESIRLTSRLAETEIQEAEARARLGAAIEYSAGIRDSDSQTREQALQVIGDSISALEYEDEVRRRVAAEAKASSVAQIAAIRETGEETKSALNERVQAQLGAARVASEAEVEATQRQIAAARERIAAERDAAIAIQTNKQEEAEAYRRAAETARQAEAQAAQDVRTAIDQRNEAYKSAANVVQEAEDDAASIVEEASERRVAAEQQAIKEAASGRKEAAEVQKATAREAAEVERQATAVQNAAIKQRKDIQRQSAQSAAASARLEATAAKDAAQSRVQAERQVEQAAKRTAQAKEAAARLFVNTAKTFSQEQQQLNGLVTTYGSFTATLRQNGEALTDMERRIQAIIRANPELAREVDILNRKVGDFTLNANRTTFRGGSGGDFILTPDDIRKTGFALERFGVTGVAAFGEIFAAIGPVGIAIGALLITIGGLVKIFGEVARAGVAAFKELITNAVEAGRQTEITQAQFVAFYKGIGNVPDPFLASEATLERLLDLSQRYGQDVTQLGRALLPNVSGLEQLEEAVKLATALAALKPEAGIESAQAAIRAGLGGDLRPIRERFEIPLDVIQRTRELQRELGNTEGFIQGIGDYLRSTGQDIDSLIGTANVAIGRFDVFRKQFERTTGAPIIEQIKESLGDLGEILEGREDQILTIADAIGRAVSLVIDLISGISTDFLERVDLEDVKETIFDIQDAFAAVLTTFGQFNQGGSGLEFILKVVLNLVSEFATNVKNVSLGVLGLLSVLQTVFEFTVGLVEQTGLLVRGIGGDVDALKEALSFSISDLANESVEKGFERYNEFIDATQRARDENDLFAESLRQNNDAGEVAADAALKLADARRELAEATEALEEAQGEVAEQRADFEREYARAQIEQAIEQTRQVTDALIDAARKRVDAAVENARKMADIVRDYQQDIEDATLDLERKQQDIERDAADRRAKIAKDAADKRLEIERDYLRKLEDLRRKFAFDSQEAIRNNDAIAYLRLQRKLQFDIEQAAIDRDRRLADVDVDEDKAGEAERDRLAKARRDAQIAHDRKLEDLRIAVEREIQTQAEAYRRELADLTEAEERKREDLQRSFEQQKEDFDRAWLNKLTDLERNLQEEFDLIAENNRRIAELNQQAWEAERILLQQRAQERQQIIEQQGGGLSGGPGFHPGFDEDGADGPSPGYRPIRSGTQPQPSFTEDEIDVMRDRARDLARRMNNDELLRMVSDMTVSQLITLLRSAGIPLRDTGGHVRAGEPYQIGKPEILIPGSSGFIHPLDVLRPMFNPPVANNVTNNNSDVKVDLSLLDPTMVDLQRRAELKMMLREVLADVLQ